MSDNMKIWYRLRGALIVPFYLTIVFLTHGETENAWITIPLGGVLFLLGFFLRVWAQVHLHYRLKEKKKLTLTGPYMYVRNPIYIGNTLILLGVTVLAELIWFVPIMLAACAITYHKTVLYEESHLSQKYGQGYLDFLRQVPRWMPQFKSAGPVDKGGYGKYVIPSIVAELHILTLLAGPILKELFIGD
jgi:protein-S-isoprenylcysteine O-methyltransferase Ste14